MVLFSMALTGKMVDFIPAMMESLEVKEDIILEIKEEREDSSQDKVVKGGFSQIREGKEVIFPDKEV